MQWGKGGVALKAFATACLVVLTGYTYAVAQPRLAAVTAGPQWLNYNNRLNGQRFSPLKQIDVASSPRVAEACRLKIDDDGAFSAGLIVTGGVLYAATKRYTVAMDAATCAERWRHTYAPDEAEAPATTRGVAVADGRVFRGTADGRLLAIDAVTGRLLWRNVIGDVGLGEFVSAAPLVWQGMVIVGIAGGIAPIRGRVMAYEVATGRELWRFNTVPMPGEQGAETWKLPDTARTGGGGVWTSFTLDVTTAELFVPVGNPGPQLSAAARPGDNLFTSSLVVLDARTGALKWWRQLRANDDHDHDLGAPPVLYRDTQGRDLVAFAGKDGHVQAVDRQSKALLFRVPITTIKGEDLRLTDKPQEICPGAGGGVEFNGPALDPLTNSLITGAVDWCFEMSTATPEKAGPAFRGGALKPGAKASGWITSVDAETGSVRWRYRSEFPMTSGVTPTAGGVVFAGDLGGAFLVLDSQTGRLLHRIDTKGAIAGGVVTYEIRGVQYVAVTSGNVSRSTFGALGVPTVVVFKLGGSGAVAAGPRIPPSKARSTATGPASAARGGQRYAALCSSCHGADGSAFPGAALSDTGKRRDEAWLKSFIKSPTPPMPKLYPELLDDRDVADIAAYIKAGLHN